MVACPKKKKAKKKPLTPAKVQVAFNKMIVEYEGASVLSGSTENLQCSHFIAVGGSGSLRFYPPNAHANTAGEHIEFHQRNVLPYTEWIQANVPELEWMKVARKRMIKYTQATLASILGKCKAGDVQGVKAEIESLLA